jgi:hypothetical protein
LSTLTKDCPRCGETTSSKANSCRCGHIFEADIDSTDFMEMASQEEEVYEAYLAARLDQARLAAERAIKVLAQDPSDKQNIARADRANRALEQINNEYAKQLAVVEQAQALAHKAKSSARKPHSRQRQTSAEPRARTQFSPPKIVSLSSKSVSAQRAREIRQSPPPAPAPASRAVTHARSGRLRQDASAAILARRAAQQLIAQRAEALASRRPGQTTMSEKMRESTRDQAEKAVKESRRSSSRISGDLAAAVEALDSNTNPKTMSRTVMECPNCTTRLPVTAKQCNCGYRFNAGAESMPGLSLDIDDLQDLL